ncbi:MAG TPA: YidC/Oxa1 family membrane protein insertase [Fimbriimonas sp.]|nr:YidC/Oxa1 family membrane protein insertase [Fimbriimonas sp.]
MARPQPKQNFLQTALLMVVVFLGFNLLTNRSNQNQNQPQVFEGKPLNTRDDYLAALRKAEAEGNEATALRLQQQYAGLVQDDLKAKKITQDQADALDLEAVALVADADLKGGIFKDDTMKIRMAYQTLEGQERKMKDKPAWSTPIAVANKAFPSGEVSPKELTLKASEILRARNKTDLIWGFIPGGYQLIDFLVHLTGAQPAFSYAFAAFLLALAVRAIVYPLSQKQYMFSRQMSKLTPRIVEIKSKFPDDPAEQQRRTMEIYREYGINPFAGCLPAFIQMPLFFTVYQCMIHYQFEFAKGYFLWINPATSAATHGFFAPDLGHQDVILILLYGITMTISTLLTPVTDPTQVRQQRMMGVGMAILFTAFMFMGVAPVVSGFVLYWTFTNILATAQALRAYRLPLPDLVPVNAPGGGVFPGKPKGRWMQMLEEAQKVAEDRRASLDSSNPHTNGSATKPKTDSSPTKNGKPTASDGKKPGSPKKPNAEPPGDPKKYRPKKRT